MSVLTKPNPVGATDLNLLEGIMERALKAGASDVEVRGSQGRSFSVNVRNGALTEVGHSERASIGLTTYVGKRRAALSINEFSNTAIGELVTRALAMARTAPEDPYCGLAPSELVCNRSEESLLLFDEFEPAPQVLKDRALEVEAAALSVKGVVACDDANASSSQGENLHVASNGIRRSWRGSSFSLSAAVMAVDDGGKELANSARAARWFEDLAAPSEVGREAATRAVAALGARKIPSQKAAVIFDRQVAMQAIFPMLGAIQGASIAYGRSFLSEKLGQQVFARGFEINDDPLVVRGFNSRTADREGIEAKKHKIIDDGVLTTWLMSCSAARQLKLDRMAHAGDPSNFCVKPGALSQAELIREAGSGVFMTNFFGPSLNPSNGDWSAGGAGFWFENGEIAYPVSEITVAGCLADIYPTLIAGSDLEIRGSFNSPSLLAPSMSIGGQ